MVDANDDPIELVSPNDAWRERFAAERERVCDALSTRGLDGDVERIEHVGSTAVPDLAAKDVVDLDVVVDDDAVDEVSRAIVAELGGDRVENSDRWHPVFRRHDGQRFNDHVFAASSDGWRISVITREVLVAYSEGKTAFVERLLDVARVDDDLQFDVAVPAMD